MCWSDDFAVETDSIKLEPELSPGSPDPEPPKPDGPPDEPCFFTGLPDGKKPLEARGGLFAPEEPPLLLKDFLIPIHFSIFYHRILS